MHAGVLTNDKSTDIIDVFPSLSMPVVEAMDLVAVRLLEHVPVDEPEPVSVQGRLHKHASFWLNELDTSKFVKDIILHGYRICLSLFCHGQCSKLTTIRL